MDGRLDGMIRLLGNTQYDKTSPGQRQVAQLCRIRVILNMVRTIPARMEGVDRHFRLRRLDCGMTINLMKFRG